MAKQLLHDEAMKLRRSGRSINEIARLLYVSKGTVSYWCRDIALTKKQVESIAMRSNHHATEALLFSAETQRQNRIRDIELQNQQGARDVGNISKRDLQMVGLGLYWGEGYKRGNQELGFTNSDVHMMRFYIQWLSHIYNVERKDLIARVSINAVHAERIADIETYWSETLKIPLSQFTKSSLIKTQSKKLYANTEIHFGTLRIKVRRGTQLRRRILGSIDALRIK